MTVRRSQWFVGFKCRRAAAGALSHLPFGAARSYNRLSSPSVPFRRAHLLERDEKLSDVKRLPQSCIDVYAARERFLRGRDDHDWNAGFESTRLETQNLARQARYMPVHDDQVGIKSPQDGNRPVSVCDCAQRVTVRFEKPSQRSAS